ncbi:hypothetical protein ACFFVB_03455 [Formosa undariae]|uniref:DUF4190 domain-containing protein n=1 Tax=Formosa undariae TaxID=1325436 RepID=A0ABV5EY58_9FLAO
MTPPQDHRTNQHGQTYIITQNESNGIGIAGFIFAMLGLFLGWIPLFGWFIWFLGAILSFIGVFKNPKGFAIAGLVISFIGLILLLFIFAGLAVLGSLA